MIKLCLGGQKVNETTRVAEPAKTCYVADQLRFQRRHTVFASGTSTSDKHGTANYE